ncbi:hypothetical protein [Chryseobacterium scophthalmum]|uniref:hypothetical protein n=1 Tax=Chryseobacterium scophthalmum TaxID=59733 RepID=UPI003CFCE3F0
MALNLFTELKEIKDEKLHAKFKYLRNNLFREQLVLQKWVEKFEDRDNKIIKEFQMSFHSSFWEFYLYAVFTEIGCTVDFSQNRPDFIIDSPKRILVEAVASGINTVSGRSESTRTANDTSSMLLPPHKQPDFFEVMDEAITRYSNSIYSKKEKYKEYAECSWVTGEEPYVIALGSYAQVNYGREYIYPMMALLFGDYYDPSQQKYIDKTFIKKPGTDVDIPLGLFRNPEFGDISAILFSCTATLGKLTSLANSSSEWPSINHVLNIRHDFEEPYYKLHEVSPQNPEFLTDGLFVFHNPYAKNKLDVSLFQQTNALQVYIEDGKMLFAGENLPIYARHNAYFPFLKEELHKIFNILNS